MSGAGPALTIIGDVGLDFVVGPLAGWPAPGTETIVERSEMRAGFSAANSALAARHLGQTCTLVADVGNDALGTWLGFELHGIDLRAGTQAAPTSATVAVMLEGGERSFITTRGHLDRVNLAGLANRLPARAEQGAIALLTGVFLMPALRCEYRLLLADLRARGWRIALDTGWPPEGWDAARAEAMGWLAYVDVLLLNEAEVTGLAARRSLEPALAALAATMPPGGIAVAKAGAAGALASRAGELVRTSAPRTAAFDTVGAGDSFNAAFLIALAQGQALGQALATGCRTASAIIEHFPRGQIAPGALAHCLGPA